MTAVSDYVSTRFAEDVAAAKTAMAHALGSATTEVRWAETVSPEAFTAALDELAAVRSAYDAVSMLGSSTLSVRPVAAIGA